MAYQTYDVLHAMEEDAGIPLAELRVDGGAAANNFLLQFQADITGVPVLRPKTLETTALGAAYLAGPCSGLLERFVGNSPKLGRFSRLFSQGIQRRSGRKTGRLAKSSAADLDKIK